MAMYVLRREARRRFMSPAPMVAVRSTLIPNSKDQEQDEECEKYSENYQGNEDGCSFEQSSPKLKNHVVCGSLLQPFLVSVLADDILKNVEFDALRIVYNKFQSVVSFIPTMATVLSPEVAENEAQAEGKLALLDSYELEDEAYKSEILPNLIEFQFSCGNSYALRVLFNAVLENACSEQGARMSAMDSSSRNAGEMLDRLTLLYTTELVKLPSPLS